MFNPFKIDIGADILDVGSAPIAPVRVDIADGRLVLTGDDLVSAKLRARDQ